MNNVGSKTLFNPVFISIIYTEGDAMVMVTYGHIYEGDAMVRYIWVNTWIWTTWASHWTLISSIWPALLKPPPDLAWHSISLYPAAIYFWGTAFTKSENVRSE